MSRNPFQQLPTSAKPHSEVPLTYGLVLYPGFQALDVFGPLDALNVLSLHYPTKLYIIADKADAVSTKSPQDFEYEGSSFSESIVPTHTFSTVPDDIDVLIVPGGIGNRPPADMTSVMDYIRGVYPRLKYLITVCTGSLLVAQAGLLDGRRATTNKAAFARVKGLCPDVEWIGRARWVVDGNIWTSSGVTAGIDLTFAFIAQMYGGEVAKLIANWIEYEPQTDPSYDPFAALHGITQ